MKKLNESTIRVLVAEDHPVVADGIVAVLEKAKDIVVVGQARDGAEAIELLKRFQPDIVLLDLRMPVIDGVDVVRWLKRSDSNTRTVILTIFGGESDVRQAMRAGADAYLLKDTPHERFENDSAGPPARPSGFKPTGTWVGAK